MIKDNAIFLDESIESKEEAFRFLANKIVELGSATSHDAIIKALKAREEEGTTGMLDGFAIPHAKSPTISVPTVLVVRTDKPIEWEAMDGQPISIIIGMFIPEEKQGQEHLQILSKISRMLMKEPAKQALKNATTKQEIIDTIQAYLSF